MTDPIEGILPAGCIHLVAGPTGSGKTRWLLSMLQQWERGDTVFGHRCHPCKWLYVVADRSKPETEATISSLGIDPATIPILPAFAPLRTCSEILDIAEKVEAKLLVWEGFGQYVGSNARHAEVRQWLSTMTQTIQQNKDNSPREQPLTIIGVMEQPKMKPRDIYQNPRQRISGVATWGHSCSTLFMVEHFEDDCKGPFRRIGIYPRNAEDMEYRATLKGGHFQVLNRLRPEMGRKSKTKELDELFDL